uniref:Uncharacterized protein n=1 Tax=Candidatus Kentrum sp. DK TaxID=2126562 RepID=A0A450T9S2_9GAMM|nr:MAG: hypothetical protein BECKDK2373C_GA0170839_110717 [Candidatus Kentron sp. DK]
MRSAYPPYPITGSVTPGATAGRHSHAKRGNENKIRSLNKKMGSLIEKMGSLNKKMRPLNKKISPSPGTAILQDESFFYCHALGGTRYRSIPLPDTPPYRERRCGGTGKGGGWKAGPRNTRPRPARAPRAGDRTIFYSASFFFLLPGRNAFMKSMRKWPSRAMSGSASAKSRIRRAISYMFPMQVSVAWRRCW